MADRKLNLNISANADALQKDLANLLTQLNQLNATAVNFNTALVSSFSKVAIEQEKLTQAIAKTQVAQEKANQSAAQTLIKEQQLEQAAIRSAAAQQKAADQQAIAQQNILKVTAQREAAELRLAKATEQANKIQNEGAGGVLNALQSNLFAINNLRFGLQSFAFLAQSSLNTILSQAITLENQILSLTGSFASLNSVKLGGQEITNITEKINSIEPAIKAAIGQVREISLSVSGVTSSQLVDVFQTIAQNSAQANLSIKDSVGLVKSFSAGLVSANIPLFQQRQEIQSILTAQINQDSTLAKQLGITNELVKRYSSQGKLVEFLNKRLEGSVEIQKRFSETLTGSLSNLQELGENIQQAFGAVILKPLTSIANELFNVLLANKSQIEGFFVSVAGGIVGIGAKLREVFNASLPLLQQLGGLLSTIASTITGVLQNGLNIFVETTKLVIGVVSTVLVPVLQALNSDLGKIVVTAGVLVTVLNAALLPAIGNVLNFLLLTASSIVAAIVKIGALITAYSAEAVAVTTLSGAYGQLTAAKVLAQGVSGGLTAITTVLSGGLATLALTAAAATAALFFYTGQLKQANDEAEALRISTNGAANDSLKVAKRLKEIQDQRKINGTLTEEEARKESGYIELAKRRVAENNKVIESLKARASVDSQQKPQLEAQIKLLEQLNGQLSQLQTDGLAVTKIGAAYTFLAEQAATAIQDIKAGVNEIKFDAKSKEILDITAQQLDATLITRKQAVEQLNTVALNENTKIDVRLKAQKQVLKLLEEQGKKEIGLLKAQIESTLSLVSTGQLSEISGLQKSGELKKQQLEIQKQNLADFYKQQQEFVEKNETATLKTLQENLSKAQKASAEARANGSKVDVANTSKAEQEARQQLLLAEKNFQNQKLILSQEFQAKDLALKTEARKIEVEEIQKQVASLRGSLDRELSANADLRKKAELATQADILALKLGGFENERQLEEQSLLQKQRNNESEIADKRRVLEFEKTQLANFVGSQKEKEELILKVGNTEAELARLQLEATDTLIARNKLIIEQKINLLEIEKTTTDRVTKLLESQNSLLNAQAKLQSAITDAQLKGAEARLSALQEADGILKAQREKANEGLTEEQKQAKAVLDAQKQKQIEIEKERLTRERLQQLGVSAGTNELDLARQIFAQEQKVLELKARQFEQSQASAQRELEISIQQSQIRDRQLQVEAKIALLRAKESGNNDAIKAALELVALTDEQVRNNQQIGDLQRSTLAQTQSAERDTFNKQQENAAFKSTIAGAEAGLVGLRASASIKAGEVSVGIPLEGNARKTLAEATTPGKVKEIQEQRKKDLGEVANGAVAFKDTTDKIQANFAALPDSLKATKTALQEVTAQAKELSENPIFKSREEQAAKQRQAEAQAQLQAKQQTQQQAAQKANISQQVDNENAAIKGFNAATTAKNANIAKQNQIFGVVDKAIFNNSDAGIREQADNLRKLDFNQGTEEEYLNAVKNPDSSEAKQLNRRINQTQQRLLNFKKNVGGSDEDFAQLIKRRSLSRFTGGLTPSDIPVTVNERGQEAVTNLQTLETSLIPNGERTVEFSAPSWIHNASETKQLGSLGVFDSAQLPNINFGAIASALRFSNTEVVRELRQLRSELAASLSRPNLINNFSNDPRPDLTAYRVQQQLLRV